MLLLIIHSFHILTAVAVSIVNIDYSVTEGVNITVEVCVEVVYGTVSQIAAVELQTVSGSATGT